MLSERSTPPVAPTLMTNSEKYAHYAPGLVGRGVRFGSMVKCTEAVCSGKAQEDLPAWLSWVRTGSIRVIQRDGKKDLLSDYP